MKLFQDSHGIPMEDDEEEDEDEEENIPPQSHGTSY
jgi:hypothetical protein